MGWLRRAGRRGGPPRTPRRRRALRIIGSCLVVLLAAGIAARLAMPWFLERYVNRVLEESPEYQGSISGVDVSLWRGAYTIHDLRIDRIHHAVPVPFLDCPQIDFALDWDSLVHGLARGRVEMQRPNLNFAMGPSPEETQTGAGQPWLGMLNNLFPFRIDKARIEGGEIAFHTFHTSPQIHVNLSDVQAEIENLTNVSDTTDPLLATVTARGTAMDTGRFQFDMKLDPTSRRPTFELATRLLDVDVTNLNDLAMVYGGFDFERGRFDLVVEVSVRDGLIQGYTKPLFRDVQILGPRAFQRGPGAVLWESLVSVAGGIVRNWPRDQIGTRVSFEGDLDNPRMRFLEVLGNLLRNAFIEAYLPRFEGETPELTVHVEHEESQTPD
jgi:hypothetical protein